MVLEAAADTGKEYLVFEDERWTYGRVMEQAACIATWLHEHCGVRSGDRVAIAMRNYPEWMTAFIGITCLGAVVVPLNSWGQAGDLGYALADARAKAVFCDAERFDRLRGVLQDRGIRCILVRGGDGEPPPGAVALPSLLEQTRGAPMPSARVAPDDLAMILYTSGTTGTPKGAVSTHRALCQSIMNFECAGAAAAMINPEAMGRLQKRGHEQAQLLATPLFHVSGCHVIFLLSFRAGRKVVMMYKWNAERALELIERERITIFSGSPTMALQLLESPDFDARDTSTLFSIGVGGAATPSNVVRLIRDRLPDAYVGTGWSLTETNAAGTSLTGAPFWNKPGSAGCLHPIVDLRFRDAEGNEVGPGESGEIWIKSPTLIKEYWDRPDANATEFVDGWFRSGDIGHLDPDGYLFLSDRTKDLVIRGGENIYPAEVEAVLCDHPSVQEVAAFGLPDRRMGEQLAVAVVARPGSSVKEQEIRDFIGARLAGFKVPHFVFLREAPIPRNAAGKALKKALRDEYLPLAE